MFILKYRVSEAVFRDGAWVARKKVVSVATVTLAWSMNAPPTFLSRLASEQPHASTWGSSGDRTTVAGGEGKGVFGVSIMRHSIILIS